MRKRILKFKGKKGITARFLIILITAIISFSVIFLFITRFPGTQIVDRETCHQSVLMRSLPNVIGESMKRNIDLKCKTEKILISYKDKNMIKERIANAMYDCWWMLGEGKLDFFIESTWKRITHLEKTYSSCAICSTIDFNKDVNKKFKEVNLYDYLEDTKIPGKNITYIGYFADQEEAKLPTGAELALMDTNKKYSIIYMSIKGDKLWEPLAKDIGIGAGSAFLIGSTGALKAVGSILGLATAAGVVLVQTGFAAQSQIAAAAHCDGSKEGCNFVILAEYAPEDIEKICGRIESIP